jgi:O-acetylserine/cysteine efflux transporter
MNLDRRTALAALAAAGLLWGTTVPVTKLALQWLPPGWLTVARFGLAAAVLLAAVGFRVRGAASPAVLAWGAVGYGGSILVQNAGITRTSVSHAALLIGATPVLVAVIAALRHRSVALRWPGPALPCRSPATGWSWRRWGSRPRSPWPRPACCPAATRSP